MAPLERALLEKTDEELMQLYQSGDEFAFDTLYQRYAGRVYGFVKRRVLSGEMADDVFQAVFAKLHRARESYNPKYPFSPWLFTICRTALIDHARKGARTPETPVGELLEKVDGGPEENGLEPEGPDLSALGAAQREAIELRYFGEYSFEEIAAQMSTSQANVRQLVSRGIRRLQKMMVKKDGEKHERK